MHIHTRFSDPGIKMIMVVLSVMTAIDHRESQYSNARKSTIHDNDGGGGCDDDDDDDDDGDDDNNKWSRCNNMGYTTKDNDANADSSRR